MFDDVGPVCMARPQETQENAAVSTPYPSFIAPYI